jgi:hypothetical protein
MLQVNKMSALQTFMLVADHNKQEAIRIAEKTAQGKDTLFQREICLVV